MGSCKLPTDDALSPSITPFISEKLNFPIDQEDTTPQITNREADAFRMKAISLMNNNEVHFPSIAEAMNILRESPIYFTVSQDEAEGRVSASSIISLQQTLTPFPGETIILKGSFKRDPQSLTISTPITNSFQLSSASKQTGFPYPIQHTGWALANCLIPKEPHRLENLKEVREILTKKSTVAESLLKKEEFHEKAKQLLKLKEEASLKHQRTLLSLHKSLCQAFLSAAPKSVLPEGAGKVILSYFHWLEDHPSPLAQMAKDYHSINLWFTTKPFLELKQAWVEQKNTQLFSKNPKKKSGGRTKNLA